MLGLALIEMYSDRGVLFSASFPPNKRGSVTSRAVCNALRGLIF